MSANKILLVLSLLLAPAGCDPPGAVVEKKTDVSGDRRGLSTCLDACAGEKLSETDRATCRLNCEASHDVTPSAGGPALAATASCLGECHERGGDGLGACVDRCGGAEALRTCVAGCQSSERSADDRATCRNLCAQAGDRAR
jgi:hypothetical protein